MEQPPATAWQRLRVSQTPLASAELTQLWDDLESVAAAEVLGFWRGFALPTGHFLEKVLARSGWYGKNFISPDRAQPLICRDSQGTFFSDLTSGKGEATLWNVEFHGAVTASMVYDGMAVIDHFKRVDDTTLLGVMNGKPELVLDHNEHFWFGLERQGDALPAIAAPTPKEHQ